MRPLSGSYALQSTVPSSVPGLASRGFLTEVSVLELPGRAALGRLPDSDSRFPRPEHLLSHLSYVSNVRLYQKAICLTGHSSCHKNYNHCTRSIPACKPLSYACRRRGWHLYATCPFYRLLLRFCLDHCKLSSICFILEMLANLYLCDYLLVIAETT